MNYDKIMSLFNYPNDYVAIAASQKLTKNVVAGDDYITVGNLRKLIYNALFLSRVVTKTTTQGEQYSIGDDAVLEEIFKCDSANGTLNQVGIFGFGISLDNDLIRIDNTVYSTQITGMESLLGKYVTYYFVKDSNKEYDEVIAVIEKSVSDTIALEAGNITLAVKESDYFTVNYTIDGEKDSLRTSAGAQYIYNDKSIDFKNLSAVMMMPDIGDITFVDTDKDGYYDSVRINNYKVEGVVNRVAAQSIIELKNGGSYDFSKASNTKFYLAGNEIQITDVKAWYVVRIKESYDGKYMCAEFTNNSVVGTATGTETDGDSNYILIDGTSYELKDGLSISNIGIKVKAYLNCDNIVVYLDYTADSDYSYGYMYDAATEGGMDKKFSCKIFTVAGKHVVLESPENGVFINDDNKRTPSENVFNKIFGGNTFKRQLIKYKLDSNGYLAYVEVANETENFVKNFTANSIKYYTRTSIASHYIMDDASIVFYVPSDPDNFEDMEITNYKYFTNDDSYSIELFDVDENDDTVAAIVVYVPSATDNFDRETGAVVADVYKMINEDGVEVYGAKLYRDGMEYNLGCKEQDLCGIADEIWGYSSIPFGSLKKGDYIMYSVNNKNEITLFRKLYEVPKSFTYFEKCSSDFSLSMENTPYALIYIAEARVKRISSQSICINPRSDDNRNYDRTFLIDASRTKVCVYNRSKNTVRMGTIADVSVDSDVFIKMYKPYIDIIYVIE